MPVIQIHIDGSLRTIHYEGGATLRQILETFGLPIRTGCNGNGTCGLCAIKVIEARNVPLTRNEAVNIPKEDIKDGFRLACQFAPAGDIEIVLPPQHEKDGWIPFGLSTAIEDDIMSPPDMGPTGKNGYGVAVDLGTTNIRVSLVDLLTGRRLGGLCGNNPQSILGLDVITRLTAVRDLHKAKDLRDRVLNAIGGAIIRLCSSNGLSSECIVEVQIVGNTSMLLLLGVGDPRKLLDTRNWNRKYRMDEFDGTIPNRALKISGNAKVKIAPPLAGFIGSDLTADIVGIGLMNGHGPNLLIDLGTNNELCLWDGQNLHITACAGGPALEGVGIGCGMPADLGAVYRAGHAPDGSLVLSVLGGGMAQGFCGSGLIDVLAALVHIGILDEKGNIIKGKGTQIILTEDGLILTKADVDKIMQAKSAVASGIQALLKKTGLQLDSLRTIYITGNFGQFLNVESAKQIGLLPCLPSSHFVLIPNASLKGCEDMLMSAKALSTAERAGRICEPVNLVHDPDFENMFLENLYLRPMQVGPATENIGLDEYIKASQYIAGINSAEPELEISKAIVRFLGADLAGLAFQKPDSKWSMSYWDKTAVPGGFACPGMNIEEACAEVLESGFLNDLDMIEHDKRILLFPVNIERRTKYVLVIGHDRSINLDPQRMNIYLATASLIGTVLQRARNEEELRLHRTELVKLVEERTEELRRSNAELQQFAYVAWHDLQEPLRMVTAYLGLLEMKYGDRLDDDAKKYMDFAIEGGARARDLIRDLLQFSRIDSQAQSPRPTDLNIVLEQVIASLELQIKDEHATITHDELPTVMADETQMVSVLQNLISNAIKFHGDEAPKVHIACKNNGNEYLFSIQDNGIGIDPQYKDKVFVLFQRLHSREEFDGTGIGLAIAKKIVERHNGKIWLESELGKGTTFFFTIPKKIVRTWTWSRPNR